MEKPDFWNDSEKVAEVTQKASDRREEIKKIKEIKEEARNIEDLKELGKEDKEIAKELEERYDKLKERLKEEEFKTFLSGKYDKRNALMQIVAGTGGTDAQDWATMLLRMYRRYCVDKGFEVKIIDQSFGEGGGPKGRVGTKSVILEIKGSYAYGFLKKENGIHRIVRISPFSSQSLRHTSFASVEILPVLEKIEESEIEVRSEDLKIQTCKSSGPGGQHVNKRESAVKITHLPTGITVASQAERVLGKNKKKAMEILYAKLYQLEMKKKEKELKNIKGEEVLVSWGNQIRSYVFHPYQLVKDLRTNVETSDVEGVLDGDLEEFIQAELKIKND